MPPLIVIVGETASGKTALAFELAKKFNGEIISADSWAVYKEFTIGTAKPSVDELAQVQHHAIDVADPLDGYSAVLFQQQARQAIDTIVARGKIPILAGGTGLYVDSVIYDYGFLPASDPDLRTELNAMTHEQVLQRAHDMKLDMYDIDVRNKRRVIRLIENNGKRPTKGPLRANTLILGVHANREALADRVALRTDAMLAAGLEQEVHKLSEKYGWDVEPMKGVGYAQWREYFAGTQSLDETRARIIKATLDLAKRQRTWFKRNKSIQWLTASNKSEQAVELVATFLGTLR